MRISENWDIWFSGKPYESYRHLRDPETKLDGLRKNYPSIVDDALNYTVELLQEEAEVLP